MNLPSLSLKHRTLVLSVVLVLFSAGLFNFATMSRREDPQIRIRDAVIITSWPGASAERVEEIVTDRLEKAVAEVAEISTTQSKSMTGLSVIQVTANDHVVDTDQVWDKVRAKVVASRRQLPSEVGDPVVNSDFGDVYEIVIALYQDPTLDTAAAVSKRTPRELQVYAEHIGDQLELIEGVSRVQYWGVQPERVYIEIESTDWANINITAAELQENFSSRNIVLTGGGIDGKRMHYSLITSGEFSTIEQLGELVVARSKNDLPVRLADLPVQITRRYKEPPDSLVHVTRPAMSHQPSVVFGVTMKSGYNLVKVGQEVDDFLEKITANYLAKDIQLVKINDLPRQVDARIQALQGNLIQGVVIVFTVSLLVMGWRPALLTASAIPLSMVSAFAVVRYLNVELEQFAVASLIIVLGMVVDNAIVVTDNTIFLMRTGVPKLEAVRKSAQTLSAPLVTSTLTTIFAFLPMLTIVGDVGEYVSSLPIVVAVTLIFSYLTAMSVIPVASTWILVSAPPAGRKLDNNTLNARVYTTVIGWCLDHHGVVLGGVFIFFISCLAFIPAIGSQFFPSGQRDQFFIKIWLPEGMPIVRTEQVARSVEDILVANSSISDSGSIRERLASATTFIGTGGPRLMLTQEPEYNYPYLAFILVNTQSAEDTRGYVEAVRKVVSHIPEARVTVDTFMLGPPVRDPVAFRLSGFDRDVLRDYATKMVEIFKRTRGIVAAYQNWGVSTSQVEIQIDQHAASLAGVTNKDVAVTLRSLLSGALLTNFREDDYQVPVLLRSMRGQRRDLNDLTGIFVSGSTGKIPLETVAEVVAEWAPATIARRNNFPTVTVGAHVEAGVLPNRVSAMIGMELERLTENMPDGYFLELAGEDEETVKAQKQVVRAVGLATLLIMLALIVQYNSILKPLIILLTIPLGLTGVLIGLYVTGWPMGFMAMLGALSMAGIVINNAIVLIDVIETRVSEGVSLREAVITAGVLRMRPIMMTSMTTIGGLLPLSLFGGPLWAPMTNGMIAGLLVSTLLTLVVIPTLYVLFVEKFKMTILN